MLCCRSWSLGSCNARFGSFPSQINGPRVKSKEHQLPEKILYLIPDTNLFIQCSPLHEIDWSAHSDFSSFEEIHILVCNPVNREIDKQKTRGNDRIGRRARKTSSIFREILINEQGCREIRGEEPIIKLLVGLDIRPSPELNVPSQLDYNVTDDEIVGCVHRFKQQHPGEDVRLLTHDGGPMATAQRMSLPFEPIPDTWLLPPEASDVEKENRRLRQELLRQRKAEPEFEVNLIDDKGRQVDSLEVSWQSYEPLTKEDIAEYIDELMFNFPMANNFTTNVNPMSFANALVHTPRGEDIRRYQNEEYPAWLEECRSILANIHNRLDELNAPMFCIEVRNAGLRPGKDALVEILAKGPFKIRPLLHQDEFEEEQQGMSLPLPPAPPKPRSLLEGIRLREPSYPMHLPFQGNDPNRFYFKPHRPESPVDSFSLECKQWRHGPNIESIDGNMFLNSSSPKLEGALEVVIQAENLSEPVVRTFPMRFSVQKCDTVQHARNLIRRTWLPAGN